MYFLDFTVNIESVYISTALALRYIVMTASVGIRALGPLRWAALGGGAGERIFIKTPSENTMNTSVPPHTARVRRYRLQTGGRPGQERKE